MDQSGDDLDDAVPISALQHYSYCPRQCALIHMEQTFDENLYTLRGRAVHEQVDMSESRLEEGMRIERALPLYSRCVGLVGKADVVEFAVDGTPYPVEYKHGPRRSSEHDDIQLAAQALCLEEMTGREVSVGAIYHHSSRRRREVAITPALRDRVKSMVPKIRDMLRTGQLPPPVADERCRHCSLKDSCQPHTVAAKQRLHRLHRALFTPEDECASS
ncbi:CRISPR-associated protein Cas4 [Nitrosococcus wardiae]|uniref:CRISPR-associated exonuclease Cas4 n=1 Tax=Nitrosococcus wardiae TaxID=1814290 RepID=A0A4P7C308_9GAMM|nr:CRISPR-associated protein Cas4 [Nitrosococcus wardiae]QBQ55266.1 CRISPR-associated protein Cas4 [Nitrosococcus wardiae]